MKVDFVAPFVSAAYEVLKQELNSEISRGELAIEESSYTKHDITVLLGVTGEIRGLVMYGMNEDTAKKLVGTMIQKPVPIFDEMAQSAVAEMGNVITGKAATNLSNAGFDCSLTPPTLVAGKKVIISTLSIKKLVVPLRTSAGEIEVSLALRAADEK